MSDKFFTQLSAPIQDIQVLLNVTTVDEDTVCTSCSNVNAVTAREIDSDSLWAVFVIYSLQLPNVKVAHSLQTLQLRLNLSFFL